MPPISIYQLPGLFQRLFPLQPSLPVPFYEAISLPILLHEATSLPVLLMKPHEYLVPWIVFDSMLPSGWDKFVGAFEGFVVPMTPILLVHKIPLSSFPSHSSSISQKIRFFSATKLQQSKFTLSQSNTSKIYQSTFKQQCLPTA